MMGFEGEELRLIVASVAVVVALGIVICSLSLFFKKKKANSISQNDEFTNFLIARLDKIERGVNDVKSQVNRWQDFAQLELNEIEDSLAVLTKSVDSDASATRVRKKSSFNLAEIPEGEKGTLTDFLAGEGSASGEVANSTDIPSVVPAPVKKNSDIVESQHGTSSKRLSEIELGNDNSDETIFFAGPATSYLSASMQEAKKQQAFFEDDLEKKAVATVSSGLKKTRESFFSKIKDLFSKKTTLDNEAFEELEALIFSSDMGVALGTKLLEELKEEVSKGSEIDEATLIAKVKEKIKTILVDEATPEEQTEHGGVHVVMVVGVNGAGKTTTIAKLANIYKAQGKKVLVAAADTFRAAATEQLESWGRKLDVAIVSGEEGAKPSTVAFDAMQKAMKEDYDILLIDTAGRLQTQNNLMQELSGVSNIVKRLNSQAPHEVILVLDGTTGQNALVQAEKFKEVVAVTGVVVTKLDGTPKGGIVVAIKSEFGLPIKFIGVGEGKDDLKVFNPDEFVEALFEVE